MENPPPAQLSDLEAIFSRFLNLALTFAGLAVFVMLIIGGFKYLTSGGDPKQTESAQKTITMAIIGLVVAIASWFIISLIGHFTGLELTSFSLVGD
jgi:hypothetical protein